MPHGYCPGCRSKLYPVDEHSMQLVGACSYCTTWKPEYRDRYQQALQTSPKPPKKKGR